MGIMKSIIDGNEVADRYVEYMRPARRDGDKMPRKVIDPADKERTGYARELNNYLDRLVFGYEAVAPVPDVTTCIRCHQPLADAAKLVRCIYTSQGRIDLYTCQDC